MAPTAFGKVFVTACCLAALIGASVSVAVGCPGDGSPWVAFGESCYLGLDGSMSGDWITAVGRCQHHDAFIVMPSSDEENSFLNKSFAMPDDLHQDLIGFYIHCNDVRTEGEWVCSEGNKSLTDYRKWEPQQPDDFKYTVIQDHAFAITRNYKTNRYIRGYWGDTSEGTKMFIVCERPRILPLSLPVSASRSVYCLSVDATTGRPQQQCLVGHVLGTQPIASVAACGQICHEHPDCRSFNVQRNSPDTLSHDCMLNNATRTQSSPEYFRKVVGCLYFEMEPNQDEL